MTFQTQSPLVEVSLNSSDRTARDLVRGMDSDSKIDLSPPYQRGAVWSNSQKISLIRSWILGVPTGVLILNLREGEHWLGPTADKSLLYACIDGKQRLTAAREWFVLDSLAIPASWLEPGDVLRTEQTSDGPYVKYSGLTERRRRIMGNRFRFAVSEARLATLQEEADAYLLVNGGGTPQSSRDMENAARVANDG